MFEMNRRGFMIGCSAAIAAMAGSRLNFVAFGSQEDEPIQEVLLTIFLRGGIDGLSAVPIIAGADRGFYEANRETTAIPTTGANAAINLDDQFGLHASAAPLYELYQDKKLAIVHATGMVSDTRSHFDAMQYMELGTPGSKSATNGWLTRHLQTAGNLPNDVVIPAMAVGNMRPTSLAGSNETIGMTSPSSFNFDGHWRHEDWMRHAVREMYTGSSWLHQAGTEAADSLDVIELGNPGKYVPANGAVYPNGSFGDNLKAVAQVIKMQLGMRVATIDLGGWDTHERQGSDGEGYFGGHLATLASGLKAFYADLSSGPNGGEGDRVTVVIQSEFGRSLKENGSRGTDHGHGNTMFVLGKNVNGGKVYGEWPGLSTEQLYDNRDLEITTDYRQILSEILIRRLGNPNLGAVFPGYTNYEPMGIVSGADLPPNYEDITIIDPAETPKPVEVPPLGTQAPSTPTPVSAETPVPNSNASDSTYLPIVTR